MIRLAWLVTLCALVAGMLIGEARARREAEARDPFDAGWTTPARLREERRPAHRPNGEEAPRRRAPAPPPGAWPPRPADERTTRLA